MKSSLFALAVACVAGALWPAAAVQAAASPNIIYILADDLGYGDVKCLNSEGKIATPNIDKLAAGGMIFTDMHSSSAVCTPTRYGIMTGRYNWRSKLKSGVLGGYSPPLIEPGRLTVAMMLKRAGYSTAALGKWHLGMNWTLKQGGFATDYKDQWEVDYTKPIQNGPTAYGFDYYFGISASLDMPPYVFIENDRSQGIPTVDKTWIRKGPAHADFEALDVLPAITKKAGDLIAKNAAKSKQGQPFFLYMPLNAPHTPILPVKQWQGRSGLNAYADFVMQTDETLGEVMRALDRAGIAENTLLIFTSDNGCSPQAKFEELEPRGHYPSYQFRGTKADIFDGGHRIPFIARWPATIKPGTISKQIACLNDFMATCADIAGIKLPATAAEDSVSLLPVFKGQDRGPVHEAIVHHSINGSFAIRQDNWKLALCPGSGGWSEPRPNRDEASGLPSVQLYDLSNDIAERKNVQDQHPEIVARLTKLLEKYVADGRSTPGVPQMNNGDVDIWKAGKDAEKPAAAKKKGKAKAN